MSGRKSKWSNDGERVEYQRRANASRTFIWNAMDDINLVYDEQGRRIMQGLTGTSIVAQLVGFRIDGKLAEPRDLSVFIKALVDFVANADDETIKELELYNNIYRNAEECGKSPLLALNEYEQSKLVKNQGSGGQND